MTCGNTFSFVKLKPSKPHDVNYGAFPWPGGFSLTSSSVWEFTTGGEITWSTRRRAAWSRSSRDISCRLWTSTGSGWAGLAKFQSSSSSQMIWPGPARNYCRGLKLKVEGEDGEMTPIYLCLDLVLAGCADRPEVSPGECRGLDLALLASCQHSVTSHGTFSFWASFLAGNGTGLRVIPQFNPKGGKEAFYSLQVKTLSKSALGALFNSGLWEGGEYYLNEPFP